MDEKLQKSIEKINKLHRGESAITAWQIGEEITKMYEQYPDKKRFFKFLDDRTPYSQDLARKYIKIHDLIPLEDIKKAKSLLMGHLYTLIKMNKDEITIFLQALQRLEENQYIHNANIELKNYYRVDNISTIDALRKQNESDFNTPEKIEQYLLDKFIIPQYKKKLNDNSKPDSTGLPLTKNYNFFDIEKLYQNEPKDEQSTVALFCAMFHIIANERFKFKYGKDTISFSQIIWIREKFPDARLKFDKYDSKGKCTGHIELFVEFEYKSNNFIKHSHHITAKKYAELIICWEDNWGEEKPYAPILSIKELLKKGEIELQNFGKYT
ncbi:MAG: hypothetical protein ACKOQS_13685 [Dolichospermum sp.]